MKEITGNFWNFALKIETICVTTNGIVKKNGELVMGAGIAKQFAYRFPLLPAILGNHVRKNGNIPLFISVVAQNNIISLPTKHHYRDNSSLDLIANSIKIISEMPQIQGKEILMTRPGCGLGNLTWEQVKPILEKSSISDQLVVVHEQAI